MSGTIHGTVLGAPFAFPPGQTLTVNSILVPPQPGDGVMLIKPDNLINGPVLALWCTGDGMGHQRGSAFLVVDVLPAGDVRSTVVRAHAAGDGDEVFVLDEEAVLRIAAEAGPAAAAS